MAECECDPYLVVCRDCGLDVDTHRVPDGFVLLSPEQVEQIKAKRDEAKKDAYGANYEAGAYDAYQNVLLILNADRKAER